MKKKTFNNKMKRQKKYKYQKLMILEVKQI